MDQHTIDELRSYYDATDVSEHFVDAEFESRRAAEVLVSTSIRLPQSLVAEVRAQAAALGVGATALMRQWITERAAGRPDRAAVVSVAELEQFIAERSRRLAS